MSNPYGYHNIWSMLIYYPIHILLINGFTIGLKKGIVNFGILMGKSKVMFEPKRWWETNFCGKHANISWWPWFVKPITKANNLIKPIDDKTTNIVVKILYGCSYCY